MTDFMEAAEISQRTLRHPLCEVRLYGALEEKHREFSSGRCRVSSLGGTRTSPSRGRGVRWRSASLPGRESRTK